VELSDSGRRILIVTIICFGSLIFPERAATLQYGWAPMTIAEVATGTWLMLFAVKTQTRQSARFQEFKL
jgi:hypothetical protein